MEAYIENDAVALSMQMERSDFDTWRDASERDHFDALMQRCGWERASKIWQAACDLFDQRHAPELSE